MAAHVHAASGIVLVFSFGAWRLAMDFRPFALSAILAISLSPKAIAEPLVTISCEKPEGVSMAYGVSPTDRINASANSQSGKIEPRLKGPTKDGYRGKPTFVVDSNKKNITVSWTELPENVELKSQHKKPGVPQLPPVPAAEGIITQFFTEQISAVQV